MMNTQLLKTLTQRCLDIEAQIEEYRRLIQTLSEDLVHIRATIALLAQDRQPSAQAPTMSVARIFKRGELFQICLSTLEREGQLTTPELADACMRAKGLEVSDKGLHRAMAQQVIQVLNIHSARGSIVTVGKRGVARIWAANPGQVAA